MRNATIKVLGLNKLHDVTKNMAHFKIMLPVGKYSLLVSCHEYETKMINIEVKPSSILSMIVKLQKHNATGTGDVVPSAQNAVFTGIKGTSLLIPSLIWWLVAELTAIMTVRFIWHI